MVARVAAFQHPGIVPLEMWDVLVRGQSLFARRAEPTFFESVAEAVNALRRGEAVRDEGNTLPRIPVEVVAMVGGAVEPQRARAAFDAAGIVLDVVSADPFFTSRCAFEALGAERVVVDVGQTAIKAVGRGAQLRRERRDAPFDRASLAAEIAAAILDARGPGATSPVVLALPCEVEANGPSIVLGPSTYPTAGDARSLIDAVMGHMRGASIAEGALEVAVVNDAVLTAWAWSRMSPGSHANGSQARGSRLVLTVGLGVGAAIA